MARFVVSYLSRHHPTNVDGVAVGLRVTRNEEYFQFFLPIVSGIDLVTTPGSSYPTDAWWSAFVDLGVEAIRTRVSSAEFAPEPDPTHGILVPIAASEIESRVESGVAVVDLTDGLLGGQEVASFEFP